MVQFNTLSMSIAWCMLEAEDEPDTASIAKLEYIKDNTHAKLLIPLSTAELIILTNIGQRNFSKTVEFVDNKGKTHEMPLHLIIHYAKESYFELARYVVKVAKKYSLDIPTKAGMSGFIDIQDLGDVPPPS